MKKTLIAMAVAGVVAAPVQAKTTLFGLVEQALTTGSKTDAAGVSADSEGHASSIRVGFKGTEDLGNGLKAIFKVDTQASNGGSVDFTRDAYVGLTGGFGTVVLGRTPAPTYAATSFLDNFTATGINEGFITGSHRSDKLAYLSPNFNGFSFAIGAGSGRDTEGNSSLSAVTGAMLKYANGAITAGLGFSNISSFTDAVVDDPTTAAIETAAAFGMDTEIAAFAIQYAPGNWGVGLGHATTDKTVDATNAPTASTDKTLLNAFYSFGANKINLGYTMGATNSGVSGAKDVESTNLALEFVHSFSKRTKAYIAMSAGETTDTKIEDDAMSIGIQHTF